MLLNSTSDPDETIYFKKNGIDRSIGYLIGGVVVLLLFMAYLVGLGRVQNRSDQAAGVDQTTVSEERAAEIGNIATSPTANNDSAP